MARLLCLLVVILIKIILVACTQRGSLTFVIDDTQSMQNEIDQVKDAADKIMTIILNGTASPVQDVVLVTFNDPGVHLRTKTKRKYQLRNELQRIRASGGADCPEYSLTGIKKGLDYSFDNSYVFVFTDAAPKDSYLVNKVINLARAKQSQIVFILTPTSISDCAIWDPTSYYEIAAATSGQVFILNSKIEVTQMLGWVADMIAHEQTVIISVPDIPPNQLTYIPFTVDDQTEYVIVSASGENVKLRIVEGPTTTYERTLWMQSCKTVKISNPIPGDYKVAVKGSSRTTVTIVGRTDFVFQHGFSEQWESEFNKDIVQPVDETSYHLLISVTDPSNSVIIQSAEILDTQGTLLQELPLKRVSGNYYITDLFTPPKQTFLIQVKGTGKATGRPIRRKSKTPIETRPKEHDPVIEINARGTMEYNSQLWLTCKVTAHPKPNILWKDDDGNILTNVKTKSINWYDQVSELYISQLKKSQNYYCYAENNKGQSTKHITVNVKSPFEVGKDSNATSDVEFGKPVTLLCNIKSTHEIRISWYRVDLDNKQLITNSHKYSIRDGGSELLINAVHEEDKGNYMCIASLVENTKINEKFYNNVRILPSIPVMGERATIQVYENKDVLIKCNIKNTYPEPKIKWEFKQSGSDKYQELENTGRNVVVHKSQLQHSGIYKCTAENVKGRAQQENQLIVLIAPKIEILINNKKATTAEVDYGSDVTLECDVTSHSKPTIQWINSHNELLSEDKIESSAPFTYKNSLTIRNVRTSDNYYCKANNEVQKSIQQVRVEVNSPFTKNSRQLVKNYTVTYRQEVTLNCGITSKLPLRINWYRMKEDSKVSESVRNSELYSLSEDGSKLTIKSVEIDLQGKYICKATLVKDESVYEEDNAFVTIMGLELPEIEKQTPILKIRNGTNSILKCKITKGNPSPKINWFIKYRGQNKFNALNVSNDAIKIKIAQYNDTGIYRCEATNVLGKDEHNIDVIVEGPPVILSDKDIIHYAVEGDIVLRVPCVVIGYPKPTITWLLNMKNIGQGQKYNFDDNGTLIIKNPLTEDSNENYTCKAENKFGSDSKTFEVVVTDYIHSDDDYGDHEYVYLLDGESRQLPCQLNHNVGRWYKQWQLTNMTGTLSIINANSSIHSANYTCRISNELGSKSHTYIVEVGFAPIFKSDANTNIEWTGTDEDLDCNVDMQPSDRTVKIQWTYNNKVTNVQSQSHKILGWGNYTCKISNYHGEVRKDFIVSNPTACLIERRNDFKSPLLLDDKGTWMNLMENSNYYIVEKGTRMILSCHNQPDSSNTFQNSANDELVAVCDSEDRFLVDGIHEKFTNLQCREEIKAKVVATGEKCVKERTEIIKVGYQINTPESHFLELYSVCFDHNQKAPLYSKVKMMQPINKNPLKYDKWRRNEEYYNKENVGECDRIKKCCLRNTQLVNEFDVRRGSPQEGTYYEGLNTVLVWNDCVQRNVSWTMLEESIREQLSKYTEFDLYTGTYGYVKKDGVNVPKYLWKVYSERGGYNAVVYINEPNPTEDETIIKTDCPSGIPSDQFTICCTLSELQKKFNITTSIPFN